MILRISLWIHQKSRNRSNRNCFQFLTVIYDRRCGTFIFVRRILVLKIITMFVLKQYYKRYVNVYINFIKNCDFVVYVFYNRRQNKTYFYKVGETNLNSNFVEDNFHENLYQLRKTYTTLDPTHTITIQIGGISYTV